MVRVVGKEGALGAGVGGNCSSGIIVSHIRFYAYDFCRADVGL